MSLKVPVGAGNVEVKNEQIALFIWFHSRNKNW